MIDDTTYRFLSNHQYCFFGNRGCQEIAINVYETDKELVVVAELAGAESSNINIEVSSDIIRIHGTRHIHPPQNLQRIHRMEIVAGPFDFEVPIKVPVDMNNVRSHYHHGLLEIILPLLNPPSQRIVINVQEGDQDNDQ